MARDAVDGIVNVFSLLGARKPVALLSAADAGSQILYSPDIIFCGVRIKRHIPEPIYSESGMKSKYISCIIANGDGSPLYISSVVLSVCIRITLSVTSGRSNSLPAGDSIEILIRSQYCFHICMLRLRS